MAYRKDNLGNYIEITPARGLMSSSEWAVHQREKAKVQAENIDSSFFNSQKEKEVKWGTQGLIGLPNFK